MHFLFVIILPYSILVYIVKAYQITYCPTYRSQRLYASFMNKYISYKLSTNS